MTRVTVFWDIYWGRPIYGNYQIPFLEGLQLFSAGTVTRFDFRGLSNPQVKKSTHPGPFRSHLTSRLSNFHISKLRPALTVLGLATAECAQQGSFGVARPCSKEPPAHAPVLAWRQAQAALEVACFPRMRHPNP